MPKIICSECKNVKLSTQKRIEKLHEKNSNFKDSYLCRVCRKQKK